MQGDLEVVRHKPPCCGHCDEVGRPPDEVAVTVLDIAVVGSDRDDTWARVERLRGRTKAADFAARHHAAEVAAHRERHDRLFEEGWAPCSWPCPTSTAPTTSNESHLWLGGAEMPELTYPEVGLSLGPLPSGYHHVERTAIVGRGEARFDQAAGRVMTWGMHRGAGLSVRPSSESVAEGVDAVLGLGWRALSIKAPVRVVRVVDESRRRGFAYGTLPGHPECGEESFVVELLDNDDVAMTIRAFSRSATFSPAPADRSTGSSRRGSRRATSRLCELSQALGEPLGLVGRQAGTEFVEYVAERVHLERPVRGRATRSPYDDPVE